MDRIIMKYEMQRKYSDDLAKFYYLIIWCSYGIYWMIALQNDPLWMTYNVFFSNFDFIFLFWLLIEKSAAPDLIPYQHFLQKPKIKGFSRLNYILNGLFWGGVFYVLLQVVYQNLMIPMFIEADINSLQMSLVLFRGVPPEEFVFRGALMSLIFFGLTRIEVIMDEFREGNFNLYRGIWIGISIFTGIIFGLSHLTKYMTNNPSFPLVNSNVGVVSAWLFILYHCILGIGLGMIRYKFGLFPCIIIHTLNNFLVLASLVYIL